MIYGKVNCVTSQNYTIINLLESQIDAKTLNQELCLCLNCVSEFIGIGPQATGL